MWQDSSPLSRCVLASGARLRAASWSEATIGHAIANLGSWPYADAAYHLEEDVPERVDVVNVRMATQAVLAAELTLDQRP